LEHTVSIITPVYNSEKFLRQAINSVVNQTYKNWELLLIDDCSTDKSLTIINEFTKNNHRIRLIQNKVNEGAAVSRNKGILEAKGHYIAFLDSDDLWKPKKLKIQLKRMQEQNCDVSFSSYELIDEHGHKLNKKVCALPILSYNKLLKSNYIGNLTGVYNAKTLGKITSPNLRKRQDWLIWLNALKVSNKPAYGIEESLAYYRVREGSMSSNKYNLLKYNFNVYRIGLGYSFIGSCLKMLVFLKEHFFVKSKHTVNL